MVILVVRLELLVVHEILVEFFAELEQSEADIRLKKTSFYLLVSL